MQHVITEKQNLLNELGHLNNPGYALSPLFVYNRKDIKASIWRVKEWDYYATLTQDFGVSFTVADLGYSALVSAVFLDFKSKKVWSKIKTLWFPFGKMNLPTTSENGNVQYHNQGFDFDFIKEKDQRIIKVKISNFLPQKDFEAELFIKDLHDDSMVIATPWKENIKAFYYNQKINCMPTIGKVKIGNEIFDFKEDASFSVLDWGRGVWTYKNTWYWSNASGIIDGHRFGFNLGYGFGDTSKASENMLFYDGKAHKLDRVSFVVDNKDFMKPWKFSSNDGRLELIMEPIVDRKDALNYGIIKNIGDQVFGIFSGTVKLDDGTIIEVKKLLGFAEKITNHY
ncbi:MAG: DUF2804 domain-containing protein [Firmicutes bacterium]|nr:DUF2804 domain-containing protein [Bacillota bacterium]